MQTTDNLVTKANAELESLRNMGPDNPRAAITQDQISTIITTLANLAKPWVPEKYQTLFTAALAAILAGIGVWMVKPVAPVVPVAPPVVVVTPNSGGDVPHPTPISNARYVLYVTGNVDTKSLQADAKFKALGISVDGTVYKDGMAIGGVPLPCVALIDGGRVVDALPWTTVEAAALWMKK